MTLPDLLNVEEVARYLRIHPETVRKWVRDKKITGAIKLGNKWAVRVDSLFDDIKHLTDGRKKQGRPKGCKVGVRGEKHT